MKKIQRFDKLFSKSKTEGTLGGKRKQDDRKRRKRRGEAPASCYPSLGVSGKHPQHQL
jgi:hypothetical protein